MDDNYEVRLVWHVAPAGTFPRRCFILPKERQG